MNEAITAVLFVALDQEGAYVTVVVALTILYAISPNPAAADEGSKLVKPLPSANDVRKLSGTKAPITISEAVDSAPVDTETPAALLLFVAVLSDPPVYPGATITQIAKLCPEEVVALNVVLPETIGLVIMAHHKEPLADPAIPADSMALA